MEAVVKVSQFREPGPKTPSSRDGEGHFGMNFTLGQISPCRDEVVGVNMSWTRKEESKTPRETGQMFGMDK